jgi:4-amino-4-deoxy-L-arabinose transferase-like glycosyltransferase
LVPFFNKAFTIDDYLFLRQAQQVLVDPLHPSIYTVVWDTDVPISGSDGIFVSGPVMAYLLVPSVLAGGEEWLAHLVVAFLLCVAVLATVSLARRLGLGGKEACLAGVLLVATPAVLAMASTSMPDVPAMALGVIGLERLIAWRENRRAREGIPAAVFLALAVLARCHCVLLLGVGMAFLAVRPGLRLSPSHLLRDAGRFAPLGGALALYGLALLVMADHTRGFSDRVEFVKSITNLWFVRGNLLAFGTNWVMTLPLAIPWLLLHRRRQHWWLALPLLAGTVAIAQPTSPLWVTLASTVGYLALADVLMDAWRRADRVQMVLGLWLLVALPTVVYFHTPPKYHVVSAPAVALLIARSLPSKRPFRVLLFGTTVVVGLLVGFMIIRADATLAGLGRRAVEELIEPRVDRGERVWFAGHWGFQWYAEQAGAHCLTLTPPHPSRGDIVVYSAVDGCRVLEHFPERRLLHRVSYASPGGRVMSRSDGAGFYSNLCGYLPWTWGNGEINRFEVWRIEK